MTHAADDGGTRPGRAATIRNYVRTAPWTFAWLTVLLATTILQHLVPRGDLAHVLGERSTNLRHLESDPVHVLVTSLLWIDGYFWLPYLVLFCVFHAPAERWLGSLRWAIVGLCAHVAATYFSEGILAVAIRHGYADPGMVDVRDIGVSYFLAAIIGVLTYHIARPWRWLYLGGILTWFAIPLLIHPTFTGIGHFSALLIGLAAFPLTRGRTAPDWNPAAVWRRRVHGDRAPTGPAGASGSRPSPDRRG
ncbi:rhomboid-like protein [Nocardia araoensis]|uniref:rhomboid-like protein n=1 Tax=Nocardia araoensis TaxID=228600 RepID=UPI0003102F4B|nr:rhomboid-like protein [Nocardia araoensis]